MSGHGKVICSECRSIISQCRCMEDHKNITYEVCDKCKGKNGKDRRPG